MEVNHVLVALGFALIKPNTKSCDMAFKLLLIPNPRVARDYYYYFFKGGLIVNIIL